MVYIAVVRLFPWGNKEMPRGEHRMNIWHGDKFPTENSADDGYHMTCPVNHLYKGYVSYLNQALNASVTNYCQNIQGAVLLFATQHRSTCLSLTPARQAGI